MTNQSDHTKFIFITGGVISSLGKGVVASSIGALLETRGLSVTITKADPYLNMDPGTMNPLQHGEVFVTDDGAETDLDLGHYERFLLCRLKRKNSFSTGQVYHAVLQKERKGNYLGRTVQVVPHITDQIKENILKASEGFDVSIIEIGGTVGDIESLPFLEAIRQMRWERGHSHVAFCHVTLVPYVKVAGELKTKPTQHSVRDLRQVGIQPDFLLCRADRELSSELKEKIGLFCNVHPYQVYEALDRDSVYKVPLMLHHQGLDADLVKQLELGGSDPDLDIWHKIEHSLDHPKEDVKIAIIGKYTGVVDSYKSIYESLAHAGIDHCVRVVIESIDAETIPEGQHTRVFQDIHGAIIPGGFGDRGSEGMVQAIRYFREQNKPLFGICLGMQVAMVEIARHVMGLTSATSQEFQPDTPEPVVCLMSDQRDVTRKGGTLRLGAYPCVIQPNSLAHQYYGTTEITERHRHRYEINAKYRKQFEEAGVIFSGMSPDGSLAEVMEYPKHPFFIGCQFHPELKSRPTEPHPLFCAFIEASLFYKHQRAAAIANSCSNMLKTKEKTQTHG